MCIGMQKVMWNINDFIPPLTRLGNDVHYPTISSMQLAHNIAYVLSIVAITHSVVVNWRAHHSPQERFTGVLYFTTMHMLKTLIALRVCTLVLS